MANPRAYSEIARRLRTDNALPYILIAMLLFSASLFGFALIAGDRLGALFGISGAASGMITFGLIVDTVLRRPSQLRTERHEQVMRYMDMLESQNFDEATQAKLGVLIEDQRAPATSRRDAMRGQKEPR